METKRNWMMGVLVFVLMAGVGLVFADGDPNSPNPAPLYSANGEVRLAFDPNNYDILVYDSGTDNLIRDALSEIGINQFITLRTPASGNHVTAADLASHDILIVSWNAGGDMSGIEPNVLDTGITGRVFLTGHDLDYHTVRGTPHDQGDFQPADIVFSQAIEYVLSGGGTGMIGLADPSSAFSWLPSGWGISGLGGGEEQVSSFTTEGTASGVFDGVDPNDMSGWNTAYHNTFTAWGDGFVSFELGDNDNDVVTIAASISPSGFDFQKWDDVNNLDCRSLDETITYTIYWDNMTDGTIVDANIVDFLPEGVDYDYIITLIPPVFDANYVVEGHYYVWELGDLAPGSSGSVQLEVTVNEKAEPGMYLHNVAELYSGGAFIARATEDSLICCWDDTDPNIIFVDITAVSGNDTGVDWENSYSGSDGLRKALNRAGNSECGGPFTIFVAQGDYTPGLDDADSFRLPEGISVYGGFMSGGCDFSERNPKQYETILTGSIDPNTHNDTVVTMLNDPAIDANSLLDGFTVTAATDYGIYGDGVDFAINNCVAKLSLGHGIYAESGSIEIKWCEIKNNRLIGVYHGTESNSEDILQIENSQLLKNRYSGVFSQNSTPIIKNSVLSENDLSLLGQHGIRMITPTNAPVLHNNTMAYNKSEAIFFVVNNSDPNNLKYPDIQNCILWYNNGTDVQYDGIDPNIIKYNCIYDPNDPNGVDYTLDANSNFSGKPKFAYYDPNNVHIDYDSPCKDKGNPNLSYTNQADMDDDSRVAGNAVDMGADEVDCEDVSHPLDWNADGLINLVEYSKFSAAWLGNDPNDPAWLADPNLADPNLSEGWYEWKYICNLDDTETSQYQIDLADLVVLCEDDPVTWLWKACWRDSYEQMYGMSSGGGESMAMMATPMMPAMSFESATIKPVEEEKIYVDMSNSELVHLVVGIHEIIDSIETSIEKGHENAENLAEAKCFLEEVLLDIKVSKQ